MSDKISKKKTIMKFSTVAIISIQLVLVVLLSCSSNQVDAVAVKWPTEYVNDFKNYLLGLYGERVISRSGIVSNFSETMAKIKERYAEAKKNGELDNMDEAEAQNYYYKIVIEEMRNLRARVDNEANKNTENGQAVTEAPIDLENLTPEHKEVLENLEKDKVVDGEEEDLLKNELDQIETDEAEMGFAMSPEAKAAMKARTKKVLTDLMSNEMRQLAMAILTSYFTGGPISATITTAVSASIKFKIVEYLMNTVLDVLSSVMGREIKITPSSSVSQPLMG